MVYQIYYGNRDVMFDIEFYQTKSEHKNTKGLWCSEIKVLPCVEGITRFLESKRNDDSFDYGEFIREAHEIQELRGWLYERSGNKYCEYDVNNQLHYYTRREYIETVINDFADLYNLSINRD